MRGNPHDCQLEATLPEALMKIRSRILLIVGGFTACIVLIAARGLWELSSLEGEDQQGAMRTTLVLMSIVAVGGLGLLAWLIQRWVSDPMRAAVDMTRRMAADNFADPLPEVPGAEVAQLQANLERTQAHLQKRREQLIETNQELRMAKDEAKAASENQSQFMANVSHELRTPLNGVIGMSSLLVEADLAEEPRQMAETILRSGRSLSNLVDDVLDLSKLEREGLRLKKAPFDLDALLDEVISNVLAEHPTTMLPVGVVVAPNVPRWVNGDRKRLRKVLVNLLSNAVKFTSEGEVEIKIDFAEDTSNPASLRFSVLDTGVGVKADQREAIFEAFTQGDESEIRAYGGTGLGLPICRKIIEGMGGKIDLQARKPFGSEFFFEVALPAADPVAEAAVSRTEPQTGESTTIMLLSPSGTEIRSLKARLTRWGWSPLAFHRTEGLLAHLESRNNRDAVPPLICDHAIVRSCDSVSWQKLLSSCRNFVISRRRDETETRTSDGDAIVVGRVLPQPIMSSDLASIIDGFRSEVAAVVTEPPPDPSPPQSPAPTDSSLTNDAGALRVLVAEDNPINAMLVRKILKQTGLKPKIVVNGQQAVGEFLNDDFDLVLMDINMPVMDGTEATRKIREVCAQRESRPTIIALTANNMPGDRERYLEAGMDEYIQKPLTKGELLKTMTKFFPAVSMPSS